MAETFNIELEADLTDFTSTSGSGLLWSAAAALAGTDGGMVVAVTDTSARYGIKTFVQLAGTDLRFRFYIDPHSMTMATSDSFQVVRLLDGGNGRVQAWLSYNGSSYQIRARAMNDAGTFETSSQWDISDEPHYVEVMLSYASGAAASDATLDLWIDDAHKEQLSGLDIYDRSQPDTAWIGAVSDLDAGTSGTFYVDEFVLRDDDTKIGAIGGATPPVVVPGDGAPYWDGTYGIPPGARGFCAINVGANTTNYTRGGQYWVQSLEWPKGSGTVLTYKQLCAQLATNHVNLMRVRLDADSDPYGNGKFAFEVPPYGTFNAYHNVLDISDLPTYRSDQGTGTWGGNWDGSNLERLVNACGSYDIKLIVAGFHWFELTRHWTWHPYNSANKYVGGATCEVADRGMVSGTTGTAIFTDADAIAAAKARWQCLIDSVGSSDVVASWELGAEITFMANSDFWGESWGATQRSNVRTKIVPWVKEMSAYITANDPHARPQGITVMRTPPTGDWDADADSYYNVINEICVATAAIKFVGVNCYTNGVYDEALRRFRMAQEYVGTAGEQVVYVDQYEGSNNEGTNVAVELPPYKPSKAIQWMCACGGKWGLGAMRWVGLSEIADKNWGSGSVGDPAIAAIAGVSYEFSQYVDWYAHKTDWMPRHTSITSTGLDSCAASGNTQYVTLFAKWTSAGTKTLNIAGMANGAYTFHVFDWLTGEHESEQDVTVTTGAASIQVAVNQTENRLPAYLAPLSTSGTMTMDRDLSVTMGVIVTPAGEPPPPVVTEAASGGPTRYELRVRAANGSEVARLGAGMSSPDGHHVGPFQYVKHVNSPGGLTLRLSGDHPVLDLLEENGQIDVWRNAGAGWYRDFTAIWTDDYDYDYSGEPAFIGYAPGAMALLGWSTVAWAAGSANRSKFTEIEAETSAKTLVRYNVTSDAGTAGGRDLDWRGPFTVTTESDLGRGNAVSLSCSRKPLLETLQQVAASGDGDFDLMRSSTDPLSWQFRWYPGQRGTDRTDSVRFGVELSNIRNVTFKHRGSHAQTAAIVGGRGEGAKREISPRLSSADGTTRHREVFVNATEVELGATDALQDKGDRYLAENADTEVWSFDVAQTPASKYGVHYCVDGVIGDLVTVVRPTDGEVQTHKVVEVSVAVHADGSDSITVQMEER